MEIKTTIEDGNEEDKKGVKMSWREKTVIRILLIICKLVNDNDGISDDLSSLGSHVSVYSGRS